MDYDITKRIEYQLVDEETNDETGDVRRFVPFVFNNIPCQVKVSVYRIELQTERGGTRYRPTVESLHENHPRDFSVFYVCVDLEGEPMGEDARDVFRCQTT